MSAITPTSTAPLNDNGIPPFESLPLRKRDPPFSAWGLYGSNDELGTLNRLTDKRVAIAARNEIKKGIRVSLNWPLTGQNTSGFFSRKTFDHDLWKQPNRIVNDDIWTFNSQCSSQWDGLRHFGYQKEQMFYNGVTLDQIHQPDTDGKKSTIIGIQAMEERGIVGRGILIDYHSWRLAHGHRPDYDPFSSHSIPISELKACLVAQGTEVRFGHILFTRTGFLAAHATKSKAELTALQQTFPKHTFAGVEQGEEALRWVWENFSAVAGDQPTWECWPTRLDYAMHEVFLAGWGLPIGELFDLEVLSERCKKVGRWSFFVCSEVCHVPGAVASPPNILAIF